MTVFDKFTKPDLDELLAKAFHASDLGMHARAVKPADRLAALGASAAALDHRAPGRPQGMVGRLAALLRRLRLDGDPAARLPAALLFARWLEPRHEVRRWRMRASGRGQLRRFALLVLIEWQSGVPARAHERAAALGVPIETYTAHWPMRFRQAAAWLDVLYGELFVPLHRQLSGSTVPLQCRATPAPRVIRKPTVESAALGRQALARPEES